jgi:uncharacterized membrane protein
MRKLIIVLLQILLFGACQEVEKLDAQLYDSTEANTPITSIDQLTEIDKMEKVANREGAGVVIFKAGGTEPGWTSAFYNNRVSLIVDYGKDTLILFDEVFENVTDEKGFAYAHNTNNNGKKIDLTIKVENIKCTDASGAQQPRKVTLKYNGKTYMGCGRLIK